LLTLLAYLVGLAEGCSRVRGGWLREGFEAAVLLLVSVRSQDGGS
jgi:hypothetical protein